VTVKPAGSISTVRLDIVCFSHLAYEEGLFQRPQHLMNQFVALGHRVHYCGLVGLAKLGELKRSGLDKGPISGYGSGGSGQFCHFGFHPSIPQFRGLRQWLASLRIRQFAKPARPMGHDDRMIPVSLIYHPQLVGLARQCGLFSGGKGSGASQGIGRVVLYDIMDRFPAFRKGGVDTISDEEGLLGGQAHVVIAGGGSLQATAHEVWQRLGQIGPEPVRLPSAVDRHHFFRALDPDTPVDPALRMLRGPVVGYFGAIDERIDWELLRRLCTALPCGTIVMTGPILCTIPEGLPANLLLTGPRPYRDLPAVLKRLDVALIPFVRNELTSHISPTKAPEYLAGGAPVVSIPIPDVVRDWSGIISVPETQDGFVSEVLRILASPPDRHATAMLAERWPSWPEIAREMEGRIRLAAGVIG
jgi:hypothetical protein